ncbi:MAG: aspartate-semialdehyde dehydrogenase [Candidatus Omnitrophica bacterium]|nr:aspartate-semialdehyde dehydrogenase [Candidatus Omnitrophota bacterium]
MKSPRVAILGATGAVGQEFLTLLGERDFPFSELKLLSSARSAGKKITFKGKTYCVEEATPESFKDIDLVLSSAGGSVSRTLVPHAVKAGALVVDNTSAFRMDPEVPLVVPEINPEDILRHKGIIANPNCSTIIMLVPLFPLHKAAKIRRIVAATYQAVSGAGAVAMQELEQQTREVLEGKRPTKKVFPHQIAFNLFSHNSAIKEDGFCEEEIKMMKETRKIMHDESMGVVATTIRVPVYRAHSEALFVEFEKKITPESVREILSKAPGVSLQDDCVNNHFPMPLEVSGRDDIFVGRIRKDPSVENGIALFVAGDQIRKGAALNAIQIAEYWLKNSPVSAK